MALASRVGVEPAGRAGGGPSLDSVTTSSQERGLDEDAELWVTRGQVDEVLLVESVPAGITVLRALDFAADVGTRYGGRFVQSIDGLEGSIARQQDWFYFLNGIEPDVGAAEVTPSLR